MRRRSGFGRVRTEGRRYLAASVTVALALGVVPGAVAQERGPVDERSSTGSDDRDRDAAGARAPRDDGPFVAPTVEAALDGSSDVRQRSRPSTADAAPAPGGRTRVIVTFDASVRPGAAEIRSSRAEVLGDLPRGSYDVVATYDRLPSVALEIDAEALDALREQPDVVAVDSDDVVTTQMVQANAVTGATQVHDELGLTGAGSRIAIIDTGIDTDHPDLADDLFHQRCFLGVACPNGDAGNAEDMATGHGTHVAGIITGAEGVAPGVEVAALKVFADGFSTTDTQVLAALNHVIANQDAGAGLQVDAVNLSLGGDTAHATAASCGQNATAYRNAFATLNGMGIAVYVATGNDALTDGVTIPACVTGAIGVGSTNDGPFGPFGFSSGLHGRRRRRPRHLLLERHTRAGRR